MEKVTGNVSRQTPPGTPTNQPDGSLSVGDASIGQTTFHVTNIPKSLSAKRRMILEGPIAVLQAVVDNRWSLLTLTGVSSTRWKAAVGPYGVAKNVEYFNVSSVVQAKTGAVAVARATRAPRKPVITPPADFGIVKAQRLTPEESRRRSAEVESAKSGGPALQPFIFDEPQEPPPIIHAAPLTIGTAAPEEEETGAPVKDPVLKKEANVGCVGCGPAFQGTEGLVGAPDVVVEAPPAEEVPDVPEAREALSTQVIIAVVAGAVLFMLFGRGD